MLLIEGLRSLQRPTYLQTPIGGHHHQLRSLDLVGQLTKSWSDICHLVFEYVDTDKGMNLNESLIHCYDP